MGLEFLQLLQPWLWIGRQGKQVKSPCQGSALTYCVPGSVAFPKMVHGNPEKVYDRCTWEALWSSPKPEGASAKDLIKQSFPEVHSRGKLLLRSP